MKRAIAIVLGLVVIGAWAADELQVTSGWTYNKNGRKRTVTAAAASYTVVGNYVVENVQLLETNDVGEALYIGGITTPGFGWFHNQSTTNPILIGTRMSTTNINVLIKLWAGESQSCWLGTTSIWARALKMGTNAPTAKLDYVLSDH